MPAGGRPTVRSRRLGTALRQYRQAAKMDQPQAAEIIAASQARISRLESGHVTARVIEVRLLLDAYGVDDPEIRAKLENLAKHSKNRGWWLEHAEHLRPDYVDHIALEDDATYIRQWQSALVPGLLQTPAYAEAVISAGPDYVAPEVLAELVKVREGRQAKIGEGGASYTAIFWEAAIAHPLVSVDIHREQLSAILAVGKRKNVTVQVLPFSAGVLVASIPPFSSFSFDSEPAVEAVTIENLRGTSVLEAPEDLAAYGNAYDLLRSAALAPDASAKLIRDVLRKLKEE
ncbi:helix-turn-helix domain-containing protein [Streptomyces sp. SID8381]|uniref:helix-turn-helix domain-containing protein n=1 Tax=unclassified Streptomyces TaxID=2593676 RepID=UPI0003A21DF1|nr:MULTISPECIES: helix-turn-helix transcriptional regulator [unclassified Streptomyces]MYS44554.1 helix-turn-helix domain-containing protein [Streptomyces sp. SID5998]MYX26523.1 helix-turn-helix domain-containing protein [Streptomyces sp. SID8381]NED36290.1 helix-turn-helix domain-containing protein [Streptomyces sp. SID8499]